MRYIHPKKGVLTYAKKRYRPLGNKVADVYTDQNGVETELDGTEKPFEEIKSNVEKEKFDKELDVYKEQDDLNQEWEKIEKEELGKFDVMLEKEASKEEKAERHTEVVETIENAAEAIVEAVESIPEATFPEFPDHYAEEKIWQEKVLEVLKKEVPETDLTPVIKAIEAIKFPEVKIPEAKDYSTLLKDIKNALPKDTDLSKVEELLIGIKPFTIPSELLTKDGKRLKVEVDRTAVGGGGGGLGTADSAKLQTLATEETAQAILAAVDGLEVSVGDVDVNTDGLETLVTSTNSKLDTLNSNDFATEAKQDTIISELQTVKTYDSGNSTSTPLGAGGVFTGAWIATAGYVQAISVVITDQNAATDGLRFELSNDGVNVLHAHIFSTLSNYPNGHHYPTTLEANYFRIKYTNGATPQSNFRISTMLLKTAAEEGHVHPINYAVDDDHPAPIVKAVLTGKNANGNYNNVALTNGNNLKVSVEEFDGAANPVRSDIEGGGYVTVGTTQVAITFTGTTNAIHLESKITNTGTIWIGKTGVTNAGANALASIQPGESLDIRYDDASNALYAISDTAAQSLLKGALL